MRTLSLLAFLLIATPALPAAEKAPPLIIDGTTFPATVSGIPWISASNFAADDSPLGVGVSYRDERIKADIYLYDASDYDVVGKPIETRFVAAARDMVASIKEFERQGHYSNLKVAPAPEEVKTGTLSFTCVKFSYTEKGQQKKSRSYLAKYQNRLLKVRLTALADIDDFILDKTFEDAVAPFVKRTNPKFALRYRPSRQPDVRDRMIVPLTIIIVGSLALLTLWVAALRDCARTTLFSEKAKRSWFLVIVLFPGGGPIAYFSAKKQVQKFTHSSPTPLERPIEDRG